MLTEIVGKRNELIHQLLPKFDLYTTQGLQEAIHYLDQQHEEILPALTRLTEFQNVQREAHNVIGAYIASDAFEEDLNCQCLHKPRIIQLLTEFAAQQAKTDGWSELDTAEELLHQKASADLQVLKTYYGKSTLKELLLEIEEIELREESTAKGGVRVLYRLKPE